MDYGKMYFIPKSEMSQTVPTGIFTSEVYAEYADSFDLSLLPNDGEVPLSPQSELSQTSLVSLDYIPATIYHDHPIKLEKPWNNNDDNITTTTATINKINQSQQQQQQHQQLLQDTSILLQQLQKQYQFYPSPLPSPPQQDNHSGTILPPSPCPSNDNNNNFATNFSIKQEYCHTLPPSPPDSNGAPSPLSDIKSEPDTDTETLIDINSLLEKSLKDYQQPAKKPVQDHQLLREYLQDTTFQRKHNLKPLALESLIGGLGVRSDFEPVISLALEHAKRDAQAMCALLQISADPQQWTTAQVHAWIRSTIEQFKLPPIDELEMKFPEDGAALSCLTEEEFLRRAPQAGGTIHAQLEIWKLACCESFPLTVSDPTTSNWNANCLPNTDMSDDDDEEMPPVTATNITSSNGSPATTAAPPAGTKSTGTGGPPTTTRTGGSHIHLWQFLKELLSTPQIHGTAIRWLDRNKGVFKIEDSVRVAKLWGRRKNRPAMNYDKLSRSIRQYYKKGIMKKTERSQRLVYQFCHPYNL